MMIAALVARKRQQPRQPVFLDAVVETGMVTSHGRILNISEGGLFVATDLHLDIGARVTVTERESGLRRMRVTGIVVHRTPHLDHAGLGVRFISPVVAPAVRAVLRELATA